MRSSFVGGCRSVGVTVQAHTVTQGRTQDWALGLSCPHPERSVGGAVIRGADQTLLRLPSLPADFFFLKRKHPFGIYLLLLLFLGF